MEIDENDLNFDLKTSDFDPRERIHQYFDKIRSDIESHYDEYLFKGDTNGNMKYKNLDATDRIEISLKKDKMIGVVDGAERQCLIGKSEKYFIRLANQFRYVHDKLVKVSHEFFFDDNLVDNKGHLITNNRSSKVISHEIEQKLKKDLFEIECQLFQNKLTFFVKNKFCDMKIPKQIFGYLISLEYFLNENELNILKKQLEDYKDLKNKNKIQVFQFERRNHSGYQEQFGDDIKMTVLNQKVISLIKIYEYLLERIKDEKEFVHVTEKQLKKILVNDELYMQYDRSDLDYIEPNTFIFYRRLICLDLFMNNIRLIETETFRGLSNLESLILNNNQINQIECASFKHLSNLTDLYLDSNNIIKLNKNVFDGLNSLQKLSLANNKIERIENFGKYGSGGFENLIYLNLNENSISSIESNSFKNLVNLNSLYLCGNRITVIKNYAFVGLDKLSKLSLCNNKIAQIEQNAMDGLSNLDFLNLKNNKLCLMAHGCFAKILNLRNLDLSFNLFKKCENFSFEGIRKGVLLNISNNPFEDDSDQNDFFENQANDYGIFLIK